ncbi:MAG: gamma-glutamyl-gamma-aminobutyrate hydrolase family protein, partial [Gammaproteobacteria bacterium]|nr:gamma-glutamyl-gamma-aminobutyrate hydrolase family protein [Gammaproteobacteria bacterium]
MSLIVITANTEEEAYPYQKIIAEFGSNCLVMTTEKNVLMDTILNDMTGLLLSGGQDIHPKFYGQEIDPKSNLISNEARDLMEFSFLQKA